MKSNYLTIKEIGVDICIVGRLNDLPVTIKDTFDNENQAKAYLEKHGWSFSQSHNVWLENIPLSQTRKQWLAQFDPKDVEILTKLWGKHDTTKYRAPKIKDGKILKTKIFYVWQNNTCLYEGDNSDLADTTFHNAVNN